MKLNALFALLVSLLLSGLICSVEVVENSTKKIEVRDVYFTGEKIIIKANFEPSKAFIIKPGGEKIELNFLKAEDLYIGELELKKDFVLGKYRVLVDEIEKNFTVDFCILEAEYGDGFLNLTAKTFFTEPRIEFYIDSEKGEGVGNVSIPLSAGEHRFAAKCGNTIFEEKIAVNFSIIYDGSIFAVLDGKAVNATLKVFADKEYDFFGSFNPKELNLTKFTVNVEYKHLNVSKNFDFSIEVEDLYFPGQTVVLKSEFAKKGEIIDPIGKVHEVRFIDGIAEFELNKDILLGKYRILVEGFESSFFVDSYQIKAFFDDKKVIGNVSWFFYEPSFVEVIAGNETFRVKLLNGSFEFETEEREIILKCGNAELRLRKEKIVLVEDYYFVGTEILIRTNFKPEVAFLRFNGKEMNLTFHDNLYRFTAEVPGVYELGVDEITKNITVDECKIRAVVFEDEIQGKVFCLFRNAEFIEVFKENETEKVSLENGSFKIKAERVLKLRYGNAELLIRKFEIATPYFVGDKVNIELYFSPSTAILSSPSGNLSINFTELNGTYFAEILLNEPGKHSLVIGDFSKDFCVEDYEINASLNGSAVIGNITWHCSRPGFLEFRSKEKEGKAEISETGEFQILLEPNWEFLELRCGKASMKFLEQKLYVGELYFVGEKVKILASFKPEKGFLNFENETIPLNFTEQNNFWISEFIPERSGVYEIVVDGIRKTFLIDECSMEAAITNGTLHGTAIARFRKIDSIGLIILPANFSETLKVEDGKFEFSLPKGAEEVTLICKNTVLKLKAVEFSDLRYFEYKGKLFNVSINKGKFEKLELDGENVSLAIGNLSEGDEVKLVIELPFEIPDGLNVYYWKEFKDNLIAVNYSIGDDRRKIVFTLKDGEIDEDGVANGRIVDPIKIYFPKFKVEKKVEGKKGLLRVEKDEAFEIGIESSGKIKYLAFVDAENLPSKPAEFPYGLLKFEIEVEPGQEAEIRINYPSLEDLIGDEGKVTFYKFNPKNLEWKSFDAEVEGNSAILRFQDGGF
ncbi:MAG: choice-of-anchor U domain-containing protein, partial [Archaeoglobaceae archaeon]